MVTKLDMRKYERQAEVIKALAHPLRLAIVDFLKNGEECVCDIAEHVDSERSNVSKHLSIMVNAGVLEYRKEGLKVMYSLKAPCLLGFFDCITNCLKQQARDSVKLLKTL